MNRRLHSYFPVSAIGIAFLLTCPLPGRASSAAKPDSTASTGSKSVSSSYGKLPLSFEANLGQTAKQVQWQARGPEYTLFLTGPDAVLQLYSISPAAKPGERQTINSSALRMNLLGAKAVDGETGEDPQAGKANYFTGNDPSKWQKNVPMYGKVRMSGVYPGIDLTYYGQQGQLEYDFVVAPGADPSTILLSFDGAKATLAPNGDLMLPINGGGPEVRFHKPLVYQVQNGVRQPVEGSFAIAEDGGVKFNLGAYDKTRELVIDPALTFLGVIASGQGNNSSLPNSMAVDSAGEIVVTGSTTDNTFPVTTGAYQTVCDVFSSFANQTINRCPGGGSAFVSKISADGTSLIFSTYLHGMSGYEYGKAVALDSEGDEVILGGTSSYDFPVTSDAYQSICQPRWNGTTEVQICDGYFSGGGTEYTINGPVMFVAKLNPTGANLLYSTFVGGTAVVYPFGLALDSNDNMYFTGFVQAAWSAANAYPNNGNDNIPFPVTSSAFQTDGAGEQAATLSVLSANGSTILYSTLFGAPDTANGGSLGLGYYQPLALALGPNGMAYIGGLTNSSFLPTTSGAIKPHCVANTTNAYCVTTTGWLAAFDTTQSGTASLVYSTYIGGTELPEGSVTENSVMGLHADSSNNLFVTGATSNIDFPTTAGVYQSTCNHANNANNCNTGFLMKLNPAGSLTWSSFYGGTNSSQTTGNAITLDAKGRVYVYGYNNGYSWDLPLVDPLELQNGSSFDFVATFTSDARQLLFASPFFESCCSSYAVNPISNNGVALDSEGNVYLAGYGNDWGALVTTPGTYATPGDGSGWRTYFAKITPVTDPTATTLAISPSTAGFGQTVTLTATVAGTAITTPTPTGTVTLVNSSTSSPTTLGTITLDTNGSGKFTTSSLPVGSYSITASYSGDSNYTASTSSAQALTISQAAPAITWATPASIVYGTALSATQLDATSKVEGSFAYTPATGTVLPAGTQTLSVTLTPSDTTDYTTATKTVSLTVTKATQTITFATVPAQTIGTPLTLSATASSGLAVTYASITASRCTVSGTTATFIASGTCTIEAMQTGNTNYLAAPVVSQSFTVNKEAQTITFASIPAQTLYTPLTLSATSSSGLPVSFSSLTGSRCTISGTTATFIETGTCSIEATQAGNTDYAAAPGVTQSFTVNRAPQTITFGTIPAQTAGTPLTLSATASSGLAVTFASITGSRCTVSGTTATFIASGTCSIEAMQTGNTDYLAAPVVTQSFTVNKEAQTITFATIPSQTVGTPLTLSATASSGLAVTFSSLTGSRCTVSGTTATFLEAGTCMIDATQTGNSTYLAAPVVSQSFTVKVAQTITFANPGAQTYGTPLTLSATASSGLPVTFASTTGSTCTVSGTTATFIATGTCTVAATQAGNSTYAAAPTISQSFTVNKASQSITFANPGAQTVGTPLTLSATASSGLTVTYSSVTGSRCTVSGNVATFLEAGTCTIYAEQSGNSDWTAATEVPQSFTVAN